MHKGFLIWVFGHTAPAKVLPRQLSYASIIAVLLDLRMQVFKRVSIVKARVDLMRFILMTLLSCNFKYHSDGEVPVM